MRQHGASGLRGVIVWAAAILAAQVAALPARADIWTLDGQASSVHFTIDRFGLSNLIGRFKAISGRLEFSPTDPASGSVDVAIRAEGVSTGVGELDQLLRSPDFLDVRRHPEIRFRSTSLKQTSEKMGELDGELTMLGVTQPVTLTVRWNFTGEHPLSSVNPIYQGKWVSGFSAKAVIERSRWGLKRGIPLLPDAVELTIEAEFLKTE